MLEINPRVCKVTGFQTHLSLKLSKVLLYWNPVTLQTFPSDASSVKLANGQGSLNLDMSTAPLTHPRPQKQHTIPPLQGLPRQGLPLQIFSKCNLQPEYSCPTLRATYLGPSTGPPQSPLSPVSYKQTNEHSRCGSRTGLLGRNDIYSILRITPIAVLRMSRR
jgi:hypothetical protein